MKIRILKNVLVEINKIRLDEVWDKSLQRRDELNVESINVDGKYANLTTYDGDVILNIPVDAYEVVKN
jgi:hypothetical protein